MAAPPAWLVRAFAPVADQLAGKPWFPLWAELHHVGRTSGKAYTVPVAVVPTRSAFVIGLPWGPQTNWAGNVIAAGRCTLTWRGSDHECTDPAILTKQQALAEVDGFWRFVLARTGIRTFIRLRRASEVTGD
jgi:deazaflavin-dependent oxidoreductase (nitroreductase family)